MNIVLIILFMGDPKNLVNFEYMMNAGSEAVYVFCLFAVINDRSFEVKGNAAGVAQGVIISSSCINGGKRQ